jgi:hypothetical protein
MAQDAARLGSKLARLKLTHVCLQLDWLDGQREHVALTRFALTLKTAAFILLAAALSPRIVALHSPLGALLTAAAMCAFVAAWGAAQRYGRAADAASFAESSLPPLPLPFPRDGPQPFVVLAYQRTGSNLLCGKLHNHLAVVMHNEMFNAARSWTYLDEYVRADPSWRWDIFSRDADPVAFLADLYRRTPASKPQAAQGGARRAAIGFKLFPEHWTDATSPALRRLLADARVKKIILRRESVLEVYVSKLRADKSGRYLGTPLDDIAVHVDPAALDAFTRH